MGSNSSEFNPILSNFYKMIFEKVLSKLMCIIFFIFYLSRFTDNFIVKNLKSILVKIISRDLFILKILLAQINKLKRFFVQEMFFSRSYFHQCKIPNSVVIFLAQKMGIPEKLDSGRLDSPLLHAWTLDEWTFRFWTVGLWTTRHLGSRCLDTGRLDAWTLRANL